MKIVRNFSICFLLSIVIFGLGFSCNISLAEEKNYDQEYDGIMTKIELLKGYADIVATTNTVMWQNDGPDEIISDIKLMLAVETVGYNNDDIIKLYKALDLDDVYDVFTYASYYQLSYKSLVPDFINPEDTDDQNITITIDTVKDDIKALRDSYPDGHDNGIQALRDYYIKLQGYADFATNPSGNLVNYNSNHQIYEKEMQELKSNAEFEK